MNYMYSKCFVPPSTLNTHIKLKCSFFLSFQFLAWSPSTYASEFIDILPTFLSPTTTLEVCKNLMYRIRRNKRPCPNECPSPYFAAYRADFPEHGSF